jgi:mRNA interferase MazF
VVNRGEIYWADLGPLGRRPALVVTRRAAISVRARVTEAPLTRTIRGLASEVPLGREEGLRSKSVASCDKLLTVDKAVLDSTRLGRLAPVKTASLDAALRFALGINA